MKPPRLTAWLLRIAAPARDRVFVLADLESEFERLAAAGGLRTAQRWYRGQALRSLLPLLSSRVRGARGLVAEIGQDLRYGIRRLRSTPLVTTAVIITFALGIGANAAMFSLVNAVVLRPLPFPDPDRLVRVFRATVRRPDDEGGVSPSTFRALERDSRSFASLAGYQTMADGFSLVAGNRAVQAYGARVTAGFFDVFGVRPLLGETCRPGDDRPGAAARAVIGEAFWRAQFHSDPQIVGRAVRLNGGSVLIAGVMPDSFWFPRGDFAAVWLCSPGGWAYQAVGRLRAGVTAAEVETDLRRIVASNPEPSAEPWLLTSRPLPRAFVGDLRPVLWLLTVAVTVVLGIACVNVTNLLLARAVARQHELSVRAALGASSLRIVRQLFTESLALAGLGTAAGVLVAHWMILAFVAWMPRDLQTIRDAHVVIDWRVLAWTAGAGLASAVVWGTWPALAAVNPELSERINEMGRGAMEAPRRSWMRRLFVTAEFAMAVILAVAAGLITHSLLRLQHVDAGIQPDHVVTATIALPPAAYPSPDRVIAFYDRLLADVRALPGVSSAAISFGLPPDRVLDGATIVMPGRLPINAELITVSSDYFGALRIPVVAGRAFDTRETATSALAVIINETLARRSFGDTGPVGRSIVFSGGDRATVVGVVKDVKYAGLAAGDESTIYVPFVANTNTYMALIVRTETDLPSIMPAIRDRLATLDADAAVGRVRTMDELLSDSVGRPRFTTMLFVGFAALALALAAVGAYGVMLYSVSQKTREIGVRMALGARKRDIARLVAGEGLVPALTGIGIGLAGAVAVTRLMRTLLFDVAPTDAASFAAAVGMLAAIAALACWVPARRAARIDPAVALRDR